MLKVTPCAFHPDELITNFCKSPECLLPMCPRCIRVHSDEHTEAGTRPMFQTSISTVIKEAQRSYLHMDKMLERATEQLLQVQGYKKKNEQMVKKRLVEARQKLIREFEKQLIELEEQIMRKVMLYSEQVVDQLRNIDEQIAAEASILDNYMNDLYSDKCLKNLINYYAQDVPNIIGGQIEAINVRIANLNRQGLQLETSQAQLVSVGQSMRNYLCLNLLKRDYIQTKPPSTAEQSTTPLHRTKQSRFKN